VIDEPRFAFSQATKERATTGQGSSNTVLHRHFDAKLSKFNARLRLHRFILEGEPAHQGDMANSHT
jgi:hypothetical protein